MSRAGKLVRTATVLAVLFVALLAALAAHGETQNLDSLLADVHAFDSWLQNRQKTRTDIAAFGSSPDFLDDHGMILARKRLTAMRELIKTNPNHAFQNLLPYAVRKQMARFSTDQSLCEQVVSDVATFGELAGTTAFGGPFSTGSTPFRTKINNQWFKVYWHGSLNEDPIAHEKLPFWGIAVGDELVVHETMTRKVDEEEFQDRQSEWKFFGAGRIANGPVIGEVAGHIFRFQSEAELHQFLPPEQLIESVFERNMANTRGFSFTPMQRSGGLNILIILVDFSDMPGTPKYGSPGSAYSPTHFTDLYDANGQFDSFYRSNSKNILYFTGPVTVSNVIRMSGTTASYDGKDSQLQDEAYTAYQTATGLNPNSYSDTIILFSLIDAFGYAGLAWIGYRGAWCNGWDDLRTMAHEIGHNLGANHAKFLRPANNYLIEYGNSVDIMGCCPDYPNRHFNTRIKNMFGWIPSSDIINVTETSTVTIRAHDFITSSGPRAIKISLDADHFYWLEHRQAVPNSKSYIDSAIIHETWTTYNSVNGTHLLDATPNTDNCPNCSPTDNRGCYYCDLKDTPIVVGAGYSNTTYMVHIHVKSRQGTQATSSSEISVEIIKGTNNCWGHGTLTSNATCICDSGYSGIDCAQTGGASSNLASSSLIMSSQASESFHNSSEDSNNTNSNSEANIAPTTSHNQLSLFLALLLCFLGGAVLILHQVV